MIVGSAFVDATAGRTGAAAANAARAYVARAARRLAIVSKPDDC